MSEYQFFVVGRMTVDGQQNFNDFPSLDKANEVLAAAGLPISLQTLGFDANDKQRPLHNKVPEATAVDMSVGVNIAEGMLLDWITDAEIGETLFIVLHNLDSGMEGLRTRFGDLLTDRRAEPVICRVWAQLTEARRMLAAHLRWLDEIAVRRGRPTLGDYEHEMIKE